MMMGRGVPELTKFSFVSGTQLPRCTLCAKRVEPLPLMKSPAMQLNNYISTDCNWAVGVLRPGTCSNLPVLSSWGNTLPNGAFRAPGDEPKAQVASRVSRLFWGQPPPGWNTVLKVSEYSDTLAFLLPIPHQTTSLGAAQRVHQAGSLQHIQEILRCTSDPNIRLSTSLNHVLGQTFNTEPDKLDKGQAVSCELIFSPRACCPALSATRLLPRCPGFHR